MSPSNLLIQLTTQAPYPWWLKTKQTAIFSDRNRDALEGSTSLASHFLDFNAADPHGLTGAETINQLSIFNRLVKPQALLRLHLGKLNIVDTYVQTIP